MGSSAWSSDALGELCSPLSGREFLSDVFERAPRLFAQPRAAASIRALVTLEDMLSTMTMLSPVDRIPGAAPNTLGAPGSGADAGASLLVFKDLCALQPGTAECPSAGEAYLNGGSLVVNHADACLVRVNELCRALSAANPPVPHVFANVYAT